MSIYLEESPPTMRELLDAAAREGEVRIRTKDGRIFLVRPVPPDKTGLDVPSVNANITRDEIVEVIRQFRERRLPE